MCFDTKKYNASITFYLYYFNGQDSNYKNVLVMLRTVRFSNRTELGVFSVRFENRTKNCK